jgi:DNA-binding response OmpR family regulator
MSENRSVLLIEDSDTQALLFTHLLEGAGISTHRVPSAEEGLVFLRSRRPDLIIVDYHLPGIQGDEFCRIVRENNPAAGLPLLILTEDSQTDSERHGLNCGADDYVAKSNDPDVLLARVDLLMRRSYGVSRTSDQDPTYFRSPNILAVDDSPTYLAFLEQELSLEGYTVVPAENGPAALGIVEERDFDCAVVDLVMPGMDGIELCRLLRAGRNDTETALPVLIVTSRGSKEKMMEALDCGADDFVDKANDTTVLKARIRALLRRKSLHDERQRAQRRLNLKELEIVRELTGGIAHDFNNLLAVILGNSEILSEEVDDPELKEIAALIMATAERGAALTERLLAFGRRQALHPETVRLSEEIGSLLETFQRTLGETVIVETIIGAGVGEYAHVDRSLFRSALGNLLMNARDAMPEGGALSISVDGFDARNCSLSGLQPGRYLRITVRDTGTGMTREVVERAFDPFFTTKSMGNGSGMGLSMVYGFARQSGGQVTIESRVGRGTSVHLFLPVALEAYTQKEAVPGPPSAITSEGNEKVLLVEDEPDVRRLVSNQLAGLGYDVLEAEAGAPALEILRSGSQVDLLFTDLLMPGGMNGFDLVERARELSPHIKVLLTTGYAAESESIIANIKEPILKKPYKKQQLAEALRNALERAA